MACPIIIAMECYSRRSACIYCLICYSFESRWHAYAKSGGRESPGMRVTFFRLAERKSPKKGRPYCARPFAALRATCDARTGGAPQNSLRATRSVQTTAASQCTKCVCPSAHARTPCPELLGTRRREPQNGQPHGPLLRCAALGPVSRAQAPRAAKAGPSAAMARMAIGCLDVRLSTPCWLRLRRGCCGVARASERACFVN